MVPSYFTTLFGHAALSPTHPASSSHEPRAAASTSCCLLDELKLCRLRMLLTEESTALRDVDMDELRVQVWRGLVRSSDFGQRVGAGAAVPYRANRFFLLYPRAPNWNKAEQNPHSLIRGGAPALWFRP